jgi:protein TonB
MNRALIVLFLFIGLRCFSQVEKIKVQKQSIEEIPAEPYAVEEQPEFPGGISAMVQYLKKNLPLPNTNCQDFFYGTIYIKFTVSELGEVGDVLVLRGLKDCSLYDSTLIKVIQAMPKFKPAYLDGKPVKCYFNLPVRVHWQ